MAGQVIVTLRDKQWTCTVANTFTELTQGLSGVPSIPAGTGMLFDLGVDYKTIQIDMTRMLFPLDIIFINSTQGVVGVMNNVQPGETDVRLENEMLPGARCFLEVNAAEAEGIEVGDNAAIQGYTAPGQPDIGSIVQAFQLDMGLVTALLAFLTETGALEAETRVAEKAVGGA
jgi:uncharacterized membrane protein (UPF0127 family)